MSEPLFYSIVFILVIIVGISIYSRHVNEAAIFLSIFAAMISLIANQMVIFDMTDNKHEPPKPMPEPPKPDNTNNDIYTEVVDDPDIFDLAKKRHNDGRSRIFGFETLGRPNSKDGSSALDQIWKGIKLRLDNQKINISDDKKTDNMIDHFTSDIDIEHFVNDPAKSQGDKKDSKSGESKDPKESAEKKEVKPDPLSLNAAYYVGPRQLKSKKNQELITKYGKLSEVVHTTTPIEENTDYLNDPPYTKDVNTRTSGLSQASYKVKMATRNLSTFDQKKLEDSKYRNRENKSLIGQQRARDPERLRKYFAEELEHREKSQWWGN